jgi:hypothetical protein
MRGLSCLLGMLLAVLAGCQTASLSPIYTQETIASDDRIVGRWVQEEKLEKPDAVVVIEKGEEDRYIFQIVDAQGADEPPPLPHAGKLEMVLTKIGQSVFADLAAHPKWMEEAGELEVFAAPLHYFLLLDIEQERIGVRVMEHAWLQERLKADPGEISHFVSRGGRIADPEDPPATWAHEESIVLTASTRKVRAFLEKAAGEEQAWSEALVYVREKSKEGQAPPR